MPLFLPLRLSVFVNYSLSVSVSVSVSVPVFFSGFVSVSVSVPVSVSVSASISVSLSLSRLGLRPCLFYPSPAIAFTFVYSRVHRIHIPPMYALSIYRVIFSYIDQMSPKQRDM